MDNEDNTTPLGADTVGVVTAATEQQQTVKDTKAAPRSFAHVVQQSVRELTGSQEHSDHKKVVTAIYVDQINVAIASLL
jgi:flagellar hook-basal body complex protein FliE